MEANSNNGHNNQLQGLCWGFVKLGIQALTLSGPYHARAMYPLVQRRPVPEYRRAADAIASPRAGVARVALDGMDGRAVAGLHDAHVVGAAVPSPVEEHDVARLRLVPTVMP